MDAVEAIRKWTRRTETLHKNALAEARSEETTKLLAEVEEAVQSTLNESKKARECLTGLQKHKSGREGAKIRSVSRQLLEETREFERIQAEYREKYRKQLERQMRLIDPTGEAGMIGNLNLSDSQTSLLLSQQIFKHADDTKARLLLQSLKERNTEIHELEKGVEEVRQLFAEIAAIVNEQGDQIDKVEEYVQEVCGNVEKTVGHLDQTVEIHRKKQARRRAAMLISVVILALLVGIIANELGLFSLIYRIFC